MKNNKGTTQSFSAVGGFEKMEEYKTDISKVMTVSCKNTSNTIVSEKYGNRDSSSTIYKYVTMAVNNIPDAQGIAVRFYVVKNGVTYYAGYTNSEGNRYRGCCASYQTLADS